MTRISFIVLGLFIVGCSSAPKATEQAATASAGAKVAVKAEAKKKTSETKAKAEQATSAADSAGTITCTSGKDERLIKVVAEANGCKATYTKFGAESNVGSSANGMEYCNQVAEKIQKNLMGAGYTCK